MTKLEVLEGSTGSTEQSIAGHERSKLVREELSVVTKASRQFVYQYNHDRRQEVEQDLTGDRETPIIGSTVIRNGKEWKVVHVIAPVALNGTVPVVRVFLTDRLKAAELRVRHLRG